jgi:hypothetical protein
MKDFYMTRDGRFIFWFAAAVKCPTDKSSNQNGCYRDYSEVIVVSAIAHNAGVAATYRLPDEGMH